MQAVTTMIKHHRLSTATLAALVLAAHSALAPAATTISTPFRGVTHIERTETSPRLVVMHIVQIDLSDPGISFLTTPGNGAAPGEFTGQKTSTFVSTNNLQIGINADFFSSAGTGPNGEIYRNVSHIAASNGSQISPWSGGGSTREGGMNLSQTNVPTLIRPLNVNQSNYLTNPPLTVYNAVGGNERMIQAGTVIATDTTLHPRTCIGYDASNRLYLFTVDGRQPGYSDGMNLVEIANFMKTEYAVTNLLNLDGGGSTTMVFRDPVLR